MIRKEQGLKAYEDWLNLRKKNKYRSNVRGTSAKVLTEIPSVSKSKVQHPANWDRRVTVSK